MIFQECDIALLSSAILDPKTIVSQPIDAG